MMRSLLLILILVLCSNPSSGEVYRWTDDSGGVHYTDDYNQIPEKYRKKINVLEDEAPRKPEKKENNSAQKEKEPVYKDTMGRGEEFWRGRVTEVKNKIRTLQERDQILRIRYNELTIKYNETKSSVERGTIRIEREQIKSEMDQVRAQIEEARTLLEKKIPEEADFYKAKPEWVKP